MERGVRQLTHLFVNYAPGGRSSRVVEEFIASPLMQQFKEQHSGVVIEAVKTKKTFPFIQAAYRNKHGSSLSLLDCRTPDSILSHCQRLANQKGRAPGVLGNLVRQPWAMESKSFSLQGRWNPEFSLKSNQEQLVPLQQTQTHTLGLAPPIDAPAPKPAAAAQPNA